MLRILPWNPNTGFEKMPSQNPSTFSHDAATVLSCNSAAAKRKRSFDSSAFPAPAAATGEPKVVRPIVIDIDIAKAQSQAQVALQLPTKVTAIPTTTSTPVVLAHPSASVSGLAVDSKMEAAPVESCPVKLRSKREAMVATMRQTISTQLNLEILLKHRELRLIDQELAKCQIALEQLRRCSEIPYPAMQLPSEQVSSGKGAAVRKGSDKHSARSPAPWGVVNGPYSRHYAKWLLQDPYFDGGESEIVRHAPVHGHSTRGHHTDFAQLAGKTSRSQRGLHAGLPPGYAEPKQKPTGPMILKRKSDGQMVKLVCPDCHRFDFGSAQGFINHCRIGHQRNFASHDAAAEGCGQLLDADDLTAAKQAPVQAVSLSASTTPVTHSVPSTPIVVATAPVTPVATPCAQLTLSLNTVHPLVKSAHNTPREVLTTPLVSGGFVSKSDRKIRKLKSARATTPACSATPNLSAFIQKRGIDVDLRLAVVDAKTKTEPEFDLMDYFTESDSPLPTPGCGSGRHPQAAGKKQFGKSISSISQARKPSFARACDDDVSDAASSVNIADKDDHFGQFPHLLPSPTNDSTQAPSLIDDDEEMEPQSPPSSDEIDDSDVHFHIRDDENEDNSGMRGDISAPTPTCTQPTQPMQQPMTRPASVKQNRAFTFVAETPYSNEQNDRKRRKLGD